MARKTKTDSMSTAAVMDDPNQATIVVPLADPPSNESQSRRVDLTMTQREKAAFMRIRAGLRQSGATLSNGKPVWSNGDVLRWLVAQVDPNNPKNRTSDSADFS